MFSGGPFVSAVAAVYEADIQGATLWRSTGPKRFGRSGLGASLPSDARRKTEGQERNKV